MKTLSTYAGVALALMLTAQTGFAAEFEVGRATIEVPGEGWRSIDLGDGSQGYTGGSTVQGKIPGDNKVLVRQSADKRIQTIVMIKSSQSGLATGRLVYNTSCDGDENLFAKGNSGARTNYFECVRVWKRYQSAPVMDAFAKELTPILRDSGATLPARFWPIWSRFANSNGTFLDVTVLQGADFVGIEGAVEETLPADIPRENVAWALELAKNVRASVGSMSGRMLLPSFDQTKAKNGVTN